MRAFKTISSIFLAVLILVSSTSFMIGMHFCMGEVQNIAFFSEADGCEKEQSLPPCHRHVKIPCCEDKTVVHKGDSFNGSIAHFNFPIPISVAVGYPVLLISEIVPSAPISRIQFCNYDPPLRSCDLTIEHQVFLI